MQQVYLFKVLILFHSWISGLPGKKMNLTSYMKEIKSYPSIRNRMASRISELTTNFFDFSNLVTC